MADHQNTLVSLRAIARADLPVLFQFQTDPESCQMAMVRPRSAESFHAVWESILANPEAPAQAILENGVLVGSIGHFKMDGLDAVGYAVGRPYWGRGIATKALALFLESIPIRPLHARAASTNAASLRVLQRCGFVITGARHAPETERYLACDEVSLVLQ